MFSVFQSLKPPLAMLKPCLNRGKLFVNFLLREFPILLRLNLFFLRLPSSIYYFFLSFKGYNFFAWDQDSRYSDVCHVLCNGSSVLGTLDLIDKSDFVITMNSGILLPVKIDIHVQELLDIPFFSRQTDKDNPITTSFNNQVYFDTLCLCKKLNVKLLLKKIKLFDFFPPILSPKPFLFVLKEFNFWPQFTSGLRLSYLVKSILLNDSGLICQISSSSLTCIVIAKRLGFKKIVVHGLDGGGKHFFHLLNDIQSSDDHVLSLVKLYKIMFPFDKDFEYDAAISAKSLFNIYSSCLSTLGVSLVLA